MNLRKILMISMVVTLVFVRCLLWSWWLLPIFIAGFVYIRIGWQMVIWRRKMASRIYKDIVINYNNEFAPYSRYSLIFPFSFFAMNFTTKVLKLGNEKAKWPLTFLISYKKKAPWYYKIFVLIFWPLLFVYGFATSIIIPLVWKLCTLIYGFLEKIILMTWKALHFAKIPDRHDLDPDDDEGEG